MEVLPRVLRTVPTVSVGGIVACAAEVCSSLDGTVDFRYVVLPLLVRGSTGLGVTEKAVLSHDGRERLSHGERERIPVLDGRVCGADVSALYGISFGLIRSRQSDTPQAPERMTDPDPYH
jgi:hypothetical protein